MRTRNLPGPINLLLLAAAAGLLSGCASNFAPGAATPEQTPIGEIHGNVHGGNFPVTGAQIYLFAAGQSGYGTSAKSLMTSGGSGVSCSNPVVSGACYVKTDSNGDFSVGGDYSCTEGQQVYMVAVGGNPGLGTISTTATFSASSYTITVASASNVNVGATITGNGVGGTVTAVSGTTVTLSQKTTSSGSNVQVAFAVYNPAIAQMAGLGQCPAAGNMAGPVPYLVINEVTTVGFAYAMGGFATTPYNVSSDASGETAIANAMKNFQNIVNIANGQAYPQYVIGNTKSVSPAARINTLANILATCVNQTNSTASSCTNLFKYATTTTGTQATDEGSAIFNIVHNQAVQITNGTTTTANATNLYNLMNGNEPFSPYLASAPSDWTMPVIYNNVISTPVTSAGTITSGPYNIDFDASGDAWIGDRVNGVIEVSPQGAVTTFSNASEGFKMVKGVAVSPQDGTIWVSDFGNNKVYVMSPNGTIDSTITQHLTSNGPVSTVFALNPIAGGDYMAYEVDETVPGIVQFDAGSYAQVHYAGNQGGTSFEDVNMPGWIYVDSTGAVWIPSTNGDYIGELTDIDKNGAEQWGLSQLDIGVTYTTVPEQLGMAADGLGNVWAGATIAGYGTAVYALQGGATTGEYTGGGLNTPYKTVVDGNNWVWVANGGANTVSGLNTTTGNWLSSVGFSTSAAAQTGCVVVAVDPSGDVWTGNSDKSVTELLGLATPTAAPRYGGRTVTTTTTTTITTTTNGSLGTKP